MVGLVTSWLDHQVCNQLPDLVVRRNLLVVDRNSGSLGIAHYPRTVDLGLVTGLHCYRRDFPSIAARFGLVLAVAVYLARVCQSYL